MKSKARRTIEGWVKLGRDKTKWQPTYLADGQVFIVPARASVDVEHYVVAYLQRRTPKRIYNEWVCSCKGFWYSSVDDCRHIRNIKQQMTAAKMRELKAQAS